MALRNLLAGICIGGCASAGMLGTGLLLFGWKPDPIAEYALTRGLVNLLGWWPMTVGAAILLLLIPFRLSAYLVSMAVVPAPFLAAIFYELANFPTSHNLIPFELGGWAVFSGLMHLPSVMVRMIYWRVTSRAKLHDAGKPGAPLTE
jgi:hypothetical protein